MTSSGPKILKNTEMVPRVHELVVAHPLLAEHAQPGHFVIVMADEKGERIPLTVADFDKAAGTITLVVMAVGTSTKKLAALQAGDNLYAMIGPLGHPSEVHFSGIVVMVAGGVGAAPVFPIARLLHEKGNRVISIQGARSKNLLFWQEKLAAVSDEHIVTTDDGSAGRKGLVTEPLQEVLQAAKDVANEEGREKIACVFMIGPAMMMKFCAQTIAPFDVPGIASLNSIMIDGTGMCGCCRVKVAGETKFTCVDGPEFDARAIDWDLLLSRQKMYHAAEKCSLDRHVKEYEKQL